MIFKIDIKVYNSVLYVIIDEENDTVSKFVSSKTKGFVKELNFDNTNEGLTLVNNGPIAFIRLKENPKPSIVAHELLHAVFNIMRYVNIQYSEDSEEAYTYLLAFLINEFYKKYKI